MLEFVFGFALCSVEQRGSDSTISFLALALALFDCRGGSKENYIFFIIFLGREFASLLHDKSPSGAHVALLGLSPESLMARRTCRTLYINIHILIEHFVQVKFFFESS
jgi:hypothetical protein